MAGQPIATLSIELLMATAQATADLIRFGGTVDKASAEAIKSLDRIDAAMQGIGDMGGPTAAMVKFAEQTARSAVTAAQELGRIERAGESLSSQLERQLSTFGKTTAEIRAMKVETAAAAAEQKNMTELAARLRDQEAALEAAEAGVARAAAEQASQIREAAQAHQMFEAAVRRGAVAMREMEAAEKAAAAADEATRIHEAAQAYQLFEAKAAAGARAMREAEAAAQSDAIAVQHLREMLDPAGAAQARLAAAIAEARRVMIAAGFSAEELAKAEALLVARGGEVAASHGRMGIAGMEAMHVARAFSDSIAAGQSPFRAFAMEMGRVTEAMSFWAMQSGQTEGAVGKLAGFLGGPWGIALSLGIAAVAPLVSKLFESESASKDAEKAFDSFARHQSDIANFIDKATGKLIEQNRVLVQNAVLTRQAAIDKNKQQITDLSSKAYVAARDTAGDPTPIYTAGGVTRPRVDSAIQAAITSSAGDVSKLDAALQALVRQRPELKDMVRTVSDAASQAVLLARENEKLGGEVDRLTGKTQGQTAVTADLIRKQVELATAHTPLEIARAKYNLVLEQGSAAEKAGAGALTQYRADLTAASEAVKAAEAAQKAASAATRDHKHELSEEAKAHRESEAAARKQAAAEKVLDELRASLGGHSDPAAKANEDYLKQLDRIATVRKANLISSDEALGFEFQASAKLRDELAKIVDTTNDWGHSLTQLPHLDDLIVGSVWQQQQDALEAQIKALGDAQDAVKSYAEAFGSSFGSIGHSIAGVTAALIDQAEKQRKIQQEAAAQREAAAGDAAVLGKIERDTATKSAQAQIGAYADITGAAKGMFNERSKIYKALQAAEEVFRAVQLAMSIASMVQTGVETATKVAAAGVQATAEGTAGVAKQSQLPFPANIAAMAATAAALVAAGVMILGGHGGGHNTLAPANTGTGTVLGDPSAKSDSIKNAIDVLKDVNDATLGVSRDMLTSLRAIETNIGGLASLLVRSGNIDASSGIAQGFKTNAIGSILGKIPLIGGFLSSLFGTKTTVIGSGLYGAPQAIGDILSGGYNLQTYSDIEKKKKFLGITTSTKYSTQYGQADQSIDDQFTLVLRSFYTAIAKAAPELGQATNDVEQRLNNFVFSIGKIDIQGKTGTEIQELLENVLGAAADNMAQAAVPGLDKFQKVGEGYFQTLVRVATTVEQVDATFERLGVTAGSMGIDVDMAIADMFDNVSDFTSLANTYLSEYYSKAEQAAAQTSQIAKAFSGLGLAMPDTLAGFRQLVEAQDLTTDAGRQTYVTLLQLAPAFSDLKTSLEGAKSAADILSEQQDLQNQLWQLQGNTIAIRQAELAKLDPSNRALQQQIYAIQDAQDAAKAADDLRQAWQSVGDSIMDEVRRIRGLTDASSGGSFASLLGQFNAATASARGGDQDAAKLLPGLSQSLLTAAQAQATSRQELDRIQAMAAASLEATYGVITAMTGSGTSTSSIDMATDAASASTPQAANDDSTVSEIAGLRADMADMSTKLTAALATIAGYTGRTAKRLDAVTEQSGGDAIAIVSAAVA